MLKKLMITAILTSTIANAAFAKRAHHTSRRLIKKASVQTSRAQRNRQEVVAVIGQIVQTGAVINNLNLSVQNSLSSNGRVDTQAALELLETINRYQDLFEEINDLQGVQDNTNLSQLAGIINDQVTDMVNKAAADLENAIASGTTGWIQFTPAVIEGIIVVGTLVTVAYSEYTSSENDKVAQEMHDERMSMLQAEIDNLESENESLEEENESLEESIETLEEQTSEIEDEESKTWEEFEECADENDEDDDEGKGSDITAETDVYLGMIERIKDYMGNDYMNGIYDIQHLMERYVDFNHQMMQSGYRSFNAKAFASEMMGAMDSVKGYALQENFGGGSSNYGAFSGSSVESFFNASVIYTWENDGAEEYDSELNDGDDSIIEKPQFDHIIQTVQTNKFALTIINHLKSFR